MFAGLENGKRPFSAPLLKQAMQQQQVSAEKLQGDLGGCRHSRAFGAA